MAQSIGTVSQIIGPVVDVRFDTVGTKLPNILDALEVTKENGQKVVLETQQHLGEDRVRTIAMDSSEGLTRGMDVIDTGLAISMPVGDDIKGRLFNVVVRLLMVSLSQKVTRGCLSTGRLLSLKTFLLQLKFYSQESK